VVVVSVFVSVPVAAGATVVVTMFVLAPVAGGATAVCGQNNQYKSGKFQLKLKLKLKFKWNADGYLGFSSGSLRSGHIGAAEL